MRLLRIVPDNTKFDFMRFRRISFPLSALMSILAILLYFTHGLNFGIDFKGGTLIEVQTKAGPADLAKMRSTLNGLGFGEVQLQQFGAPNDVLIRIAEQPGGDAAQQVAVAKARKALGDQVTYRRVEVVGPRVSGELLSYGIIGLMLAIMCILIYLWFRFEWQFALGAMIANVHDLVLTIGFMSLSGVDFDLTSIAALLTILGYSLNDTVVIYDRIREMLRRYKRLPMTELLNVSINSTLSRSKRPSPNSTPRCSPAPSTTPSSTIAAPKASPFRRAIGRAPSANRRSTLIRCVPESHSLISACG